MRITSADGEPLTGAAKADWDCAISVFERRIQERFFSSIEALEKADSRADVTVRPNAPSDCSALPKDVGAVVPGFAIVGLCCLLLETLASFSDTNSISEKDSPDGGPCPYPKGECIRPQPRGGELIKAFLRRSAFDRAFDDDKTAKSFVRGVRNGILHDAETRGWKIWRDEPRGAIVQKDGRQRILNRTALVKALRAEFERYLSDLRNPERHELRQQFLRKMNRIVREV
jgi:hypothetical protein